MGDMVLVTGADGFVGRHLVDQLHEAGHVVRAVDKSFRDDFPKNIEQISADVLDYGTMASALAGVKTVYHLAAYTGLWAADQTVYQMVNVEGTNTVLRAAIDSNVKRFVHCSSFVTLISGSIFDTRQVDESEPTFATGLFGKYAQSKKRAEELVLRTGKEGEIETIVVMPSAPLGAGDNNMTAPTKLVRDLVNGKIPATMNQMINFVDVNILANTIVAAGTKGKPGEKYLITGENLEMSEFLKKVKEVSGVRMPRFVVPYTLAACVSFIEEKLISPITGKEPKAPYAGVRIAGRSRTLSSIKAQRNLGLVIAPVEYSIRTSLLWLRETGQIKRKLPKL